MKSSASKIQMTGFDDLFQTGDPVKPGPNQPQEIPLAELYPFKGHPFQVRDDDAMRKMAESIAECGVLSVYLCANPISTQRQNHFPFQGFTSVRRGIPQKFPLCQLPPQNWVASVGTFAEANTGESLCF